MVGLCKLICLVFSFKLNINYKLVPVNILNLIPINIEYKVTFKILHYTHHKKILFTKFFLVLLSLIQNSF